METRRQHSEDSPTPTISRGSNTGSCTSTNRIQNPDPIPNDLIMEILSRSPAKSVARCLCLSKFWASTLRSRGFTDLFVTKSSARPRILFSFRENGKLVFYSAPQIQNQDENSILVAAKHHMVFRFDCSELCRPLRGLVCLTYLRVVSASTKNTVPVIWNLTTGHSLSLPKVKTRRVGVKSFFGFDPIGKQFKVLCMTSTVYWKESCVEHQILTLGTKKLSWKMIDCSIPHYPLSGGICINGCVYYHALVHEAHDVKRHPFVPPPSVPGIVCFDVRSESFRFINKAEDMLVTEVRHPTLADYKGKLSVLSSDGFEYVTGESSCLELWVLQDAEQHQWSKHIYLVPTMLKNVVARTVLYFVGVTGTDEIVLSPQYKSDLVLSVQHIPDQFYVFYYNIEKNTIRRVEIQGMIRDRRRIHISLDHVENVNIL
ncbi:hypothetical protein EUTSA_v10022123mg [Eutrema salsugineum]|uniref:F-box domain-containing protein n=1 Tax=Eutrema salsugineum TaxID=72664 RepID=V4LW85_EUTSA|nr:putative F-box protein At2g19630 [Eutrema salsugineum]ESQ48074.1 hypothetical protein EUTSA_v10022123mg [Eutrema salsugineum]